MSNLKKDIEKIWDILGYWKTGKIHIKWWSDEDGCRVDCTDEIAKATTQIINLIESVIPEEMEINEATELADWSEEDFKAGFNKAISVIKSKLIGEE